MKEDMHYDTNKYQLRMINIQRMNILIRQNKYAQKGGIVFYGDSITEFLDIERYFPELENAYNCGLCGITTDMLLHFVAEGVLKYEPERVIIMAGTNDLGDTVQASPRDIALNMKELVDIIHVNLPRTIIYIVSPLPCRVEQHGYKAIHKGIRTNDFIYMIYEEYKKMIHCEQVIFIDAFHALCEDDEPSKDYYIDGLHLTDAGYVLYTNKIKEYLKEYE